MTDEKLTDIQLELKTRIEEKTGAKVHFIPRFSADEEYTALIVWEHFFYDEDGDRVQDLVELSFISRQLRKKPMTEAHISAYPPELQNDFRSLSPEKSCNVLPAISIADTPGKALKELLEKTRLLDYGWYLGSEKNFFDPFRPQCGGSSEVVAVCGGSFSASATSWIDAVREFGSFLAAHKMTLLYNGARGGVRQLLADTVLECGGKVIGLIPAALPPEQRHPRLRETVFTFNRTEQKAEMLRRADVIVILPGDLEVCEDLFHALALRGTEADHCCPIGLLNVDGFFDDLLHFIEHSVEAGSMTPEEAERLKSGRTVQELFDLFLNVKDKTSSDKAGKRCYI